MQTGATAPVLNQHPADRGGLVPTGRIGLRRDFAGGSIVRAAGLCRLPAGDAERAASARSASATTSPRPIRGLTPERLYGVEAGLGGHGAADTGTATSSSTGWPDAITNVDHRQGAGPLLVPRGGFVAGRRDALPAPERGHDQRLRRGGRGATGTLAGRLDLRAAFTYTHARVDGGRQAPQLTGLRPAETPELAADRRRRLARRSDRLTLTAELRYESARFDDDQNTRR